MITMHPSFDESQIDGNAIESSPTFAANTAHGAKLLELITRDHKKASRNLSEGRRLQRQTFLEGIRQHCRDSLHEKARDQGRTKAFVGLYPDIYLLISSRYAKLRNDEMERETTGMAALQVHDWSRPGKLRGASRSNSPPSRKKPDREHSRSRSRDRTDGKKKYSEPIAIADQALRPRLCRGARSTMRSLASLNASQVAANDAEAFCTATTRGDR